MIKCFSIDKRFQSIIFNLELDFSRGRCYWEILFYVRGLLVGLGISSYQKKRFIMLNIGMNLCPIVFKAG